MRLPVTGRQRREAEAEKRKAVLKVFIGMFTASIKRWQVRTAMTHVHTLGMSISSA